MGEGVGVGVGEGVGAGVGAGAVADDCLGAWVGGSMCMDGCTRLRPHACGLPSLLLCLQSRAYAAG